MNEFIPWIIASAAVALLAVACVLLIIAICSARKKASNEQMLIELFHLVHQNVKGNDERMNSIIDSQAARIEKCVNSERESKKAVKELTDRLNKSEMEKAEQKELYESEIKRLKARCDGHGARGKGTQSTAQAGGEELTELRESKKRLEAELSALKKKQAKPSADADKEAAARLKALKERQRVLEEAADSAAVILKKAAGATSAEFMNAEIEKAIAKLDGALSD